MFLRQVGVSDTFRWTVMTVSDCSDCSDQQTYQTSSIRFQDVITWPTTPTTEPSEVLKLARSDHLLTEPQEGWRHVWHVFAIDLRFSWSASSNVQVEVVADTVDRLPLMEQGLKNEIASLALPWLALRFESLSETRGWQCVWCYIWWLSARHVTGSTCTPSFTCIPGRAKRHKNYTSWKYVTGEDAILRS